MLYVLNPIKDLYFDMSTKSYASKLASYEVSRYKCDNIKCYRGFRSSLRMHKRWQRDFLDRLKVKLHLASTKHLSRISQINTVDRRLNFRFLK